MSDIRLTYQGGAGGGASAINDLSDVVISSIANGEILAWASGTQFINRTLAEAGISATGHSHTESDISDLQAYLLDLTGSPLSELSDITITSVATNEIIHWSGSAWINRTLAEAGVSATGHSHTESDISDLQSYLLNITGESVGSLSDVTATSPANRHGLMHNGSGQYVSRLLVEADVSDLGSYSVTGHSHTESDISDLQAYLLDITGEALSTLGDVTITSIASGELLKWTGSAWINNTLAEAGVSATGHSHVEADISDFGSYSVVGHSHTESDISDLQSYLLDITAEALSTLSDVTITSIAAGELLKWTGSAWINNTLAEAGISATGHTHTESEITDLQSYLLNITGESVGSLSDVTATSPVNRHGLIHNGSGQYVSRLLVEADISDLGSYSTTGHTHTESDITDLGAYITGITSEPLSDLSDVTITSIATGEILKWTGSAWVNNTLAEAGISATGHAHAGADISSGTLPDARLSTKAVTKAVAFSVAAANVTVSTIQLPIRFPDGATIVKITHWTEAGTADWNIEERTGPAVSGTNVYASDEVSSTTVSEDTSFSNAGMAADNYLALDISAVSTPGNLHITIEYTVD